MKTTASATESNTDKLIGLLVCPVCHSNPLTHSYDKNMLECPVCRTGFMINQDIPLMLQTKYLAGQSKSEIHKVYRTDFNYIDHYQKDAAEFDYFQTRTGATAHSERRVRESVISNIKAKTGRILDVGSGSAWVADHFCRKGFDVVSLDISMLNVKKALEKFPFANHSGIVADAYNLPFQENSFDFIISSEVIEHVKDPGLFVVNLSGILKPGGLLVITTPYREKISYSQCVHCNRMTPHNAHLHSFDEKIMSGFSAKGFSIKTIMFGNKALIHLRTHVILKLTGFRFWRIIDGIANLIIPKPSTLLAVWQKPNNKK